MTTPHNEQPVPRKASEITVEELAAIAEEFSAGSNTPTHFSADGTGAPEATIIPFRHFERLIEHDIESGRREAAFREELRSRIDASRSGESEDPTIGPGGDYETLEDYFTAQFGQTGQRWAQSRRQSHD